MRRPAELSPKARAIKSLRAILETVETPEVDVRDYHAMIDFGAPNPEAGEWNHVVTLRIETARPKS